MIRRSFFGALCGAVAGMLFPLSSKIGTLSYRGYAVSYTQMRVISCHAAPGKKYQFVRIYFNDRGKAIYMRRRFVTEYEHRMTPWREDERRRVPVA